MSVQFFLTTLVVLVVGSISAAAPTGRERPREIERPKAEAAQPGRARELNSTVNAERTASKIAEEALRDPSCDGKCRVSALAIEGMVRNPSGLELGSSEHGVAQAIARDVRVGQSSGLQLPQAIQRALANRQIDDQDEFNEACGPR